MQGGCCGEGIGVVEGEKDRVDGTDIHCCFRKYYNFFLEILEVCRKY